LIISTRMVWLVYAAPASPARPDRNGDVDVLRRNRVQLSRLVAREDRAVHRLVAQLDANFGAVAVYQFGGILRHTRVTL